MISGAHLLEAKQRVDELTELTGWTVGSEEWLEEIGQHVDEIDLGELLALAQGFSNRSGPEAYTRPWILQATLSGALVALLARQYAVRDGAVA